MVAPGSSVAPRRAATIIWAALLAGILIFLVVAAVVGPSIHASVASGLAEVLLPIAALLAAGGLAASRLAPRLLRGTGEQAAMQRHLAACVPCDAGAIFALMTWMVTGSPLALALLLLPLGGLVACWPGDARWAALGGAAGGPTPRGFVPPRGPR